MSVDRSRARTRQNDVAGLEPNSERVDLLRQPRDSGDRVTENRIAAPLRNPLPVAGQHRVDGLDVDVRRANSFLAEDEPAEDALSAMVSERPIFQSLIRLSINSMDGA